MDTPYGPHKITPTRQVAIPKDLMERVHLQPGDKIYFMESGNDDGTLLIVPIDALARWIERGRLPQSDPHS